MAISLKKLVNTVLYDGSKDKNQEPAEVINKKGNIHAPSYSENLPYRYYSKDNGLFYNEGTLGFGFTFSPLGGIPDKNYLVNMNTMIKEKFPTGEKWAYQFQVVSDRQIQPLLDANERVHGQLGGVYQKLAEYQKNYYEMATIDGFPNGYGKDARFDLRNYTCYLFVTTKVLNEAKVSSVKDGIEAEMRINRFRVKQVNAEIFLSHTRDIFNHNPDRTSPTKCEYNEIEYLNKQCMAMNTHVNKICPAHIDIQYDDESIEGCPRKEIKVVPMTARKIPSAFSPWLFPELIANARTRGTTINCPFIYSVSFTIEEKDLSVRNSRKAIGGAQKMQQLAKGFLPFLGDEVKENEQITRGLEDSRYLMSRVGVDLLLFTTEEHAKQDVSCAKKIFRQYMEMTTPFFLAGSIFDTCLPFNYLKAIKDRDRQQTVHKIKTSNVISFSPLIIDSVGAPCGVTLSGERNQIAFYDMFNMGADSYNYFLVGMMGAGKSVLSQAIIISVLSKGGMVYAIDYGKSYQKLCQTLGGNYIDANSLNMNPFSHLDLKEMVANESEPGQGLRTFHNMLKMIAQLYCMMCDPNNSSDTFAYSILLDAINHAYERKGKDTIVDTVVEEVQKISDKQAEKRYDRRIQDIVTKLKKYMVGQPSGEIFNKPSKIDPNSNFVVIEMEGLSGNDQKVASVALNIDIFNRVFMGDGSIQILVKIEEAWRNLSCDDNKELQDAIQDAARTFRKKNAALAMVTQNVSDLLTNQLAKAIYDTTTFKLVMLQGESFYNLGDEAGFCQRSKDLVKTFQPSSEARYSSVLLKQTSRAPVAFKYFMDPFMKMLTTTKASEKTRIEHYLRNGNNLESALEKSAWDFYGDEMKALEDFTARKNTLLNAEYAYDFDKAV
jgi:conjugal transfer ATP-binding protein TraC